MVFIKILTNKFFLVFFLLIIVSVFFLFFSSPFKSGVVKTDTKLSFVGKLKHYGTSSGINKPLSVSIVPEGCVSGFENEITVLQVSWIDVSRLLLHYKPKNINVHDLRIWSDGEKVYGTAISFVPPFVGNISASGLLENSWFALDSLYIGQVPLNVEFLDVAARGITELIYDFLGEIYTVIYLNKITTDYIEVTVEAPVGLVTTDGGNIMIDDDVINSARDKYRGCYSNDSGGDGEYRIM